MINIEDPCHHLPKFMVKIASCHEIVLGHRRAADDHSPESLSQECLGASFRDLLEVFIDGVIPQTLEPQAGHAAVMVLVRHL